MRERDTTPTPSIHPSISDSSLAKAQGRSGFINDSKRVSRPSGFNAMAAILLAGVEADVRDGDSVRVSGPSGFNSMAARFLVGVDVRDCDSD